MVIEIPLKKARGRPPKPETERRRSNLTLRIRDKTKAALEQSAAQNGRSLSEESEMRLDLSVKAEGLIDEILDLAFGRQLAGIILVLANVLQETGPSAGFSSTFSSKGAANWLGDPYAFDQATQAVGTVLEAFRPGGEVVSPGSNPGYNDKHGLARNLGINTARSALISVALNRERDGKLVDTDQWTRRICERLRPEAAKQIERFLERSGAISLDPNAGLSS